MMLQKIVISLLTGSLLGNTLRLRCKSLAERTKRVHQVNPTDSASSTPGFPPKVEHCDATQTAGPCQNNESKKIVNSHELVLKNNQSNPGISKDETLYRSLSLEQSGEEHAEKSKSTSTISLGCTGNECDIGNSEPQFNLLLKPNSKADSSTRPQNVDIPVVESDGELKKKVPELPAPRIYSYLPVPHSAPGSIPESKTEFPSQQPGIPVGDPQSNPGIEKPELPLSRTYSYTPAPHTAPEVRTEFPARPQHPSAHIDELKGVFGKNQPQLSNPNIYYYQSPGRFTPDVIPQSFLPKRPLNTPQHSYIPEIKVDDSKTNPHILTTAGDKSHDVGDVDLVSSELDESQNQSKQVTSNIGIGSKSNPFLPNQGYSHTSSSNSNHQESSAHYYKVNLGRPQINYQYPTLPETVAPSYRVLTKTNQKTTHSSNGIPFKVQDHTIINNSINGKIHTGSSTYTTQEGNNDATTRVHSWSEKTTAELIYELKLFVFEKSDQIIDVIRRHESI